MKRLWLNLVLVVCMLLALTGSFTTSEERPGLRARLNGFHEVPSISTKGKGEFSARVSEDGTSISFRLKYSDLTAIPSAAHIHFGQRGVNGGILAFLCGGGSKPSCPATPATVEGTITAADILAIAPQGIAAGDFAAVLRAIRSGSTYTNVHSSVFGSGEIRGQIRVHRHHEDDEDDKDNNDD